MAVVAQRVSEALLGDVRQGVWVSGCVERAVKVAEAQCLQELAVRTTSVKNARRVLACCLKRAGPAAPPPPPPPPIPTSN